KLKSNHQTLAPPKVAQSWLKPKFPRLALSGQSQAGRWSGTSSHHLLFEYRRALGLHQRMVFLHQFPGSWPRCAGANHATIHFHHGNQLRAGASEEAFVGIEDIITGEVWLAYSQAAFPCDIHHTPRVIP